MFVDEAKWGKKRLFSEKQWPGLNRVQRESAADQVVDLFHQKVKEKGIFVQWRPGASEIRGQGEVIVEEKDLGLLGNLLEDSYRKIGESILS